MDITLLVKLTSKAWSLKILALLHSGVPGRQAPLLAATNASRSSFASSLDHLVQLGLLERNPGHGHPLRPEFRLTEKGVVVAAMASRVVEFAPDDDAFSIIRRSWAVPILAVTETPKRFSIIKSGLGAITDRALSKSLGILEDQDWLRREIDVSQRSPYPTYHAVNAGMKINQAIRSSL
ncbi:MAG: winged helix-turn-helix transcriptional regulator [Pseudomonadota bacterium]